MDKFNMGKKGLNLGKSVHSTNSNAEYLFLVNPSSGKASIQKKRDLVSKVSRHSNAITLISESEDHASQLAKDAMLEGRIVVACGGDGLQNIVAQQAIDTGGVMSVLPFGRGNDFAASMQIRSFRDTELAIKNGVVQHARYVNVEFSDYSRICLTCAGVGLLSDASLRASRLPLLKGKALYTVAALISLMKLKCHRYTLSFDDVELQKELLILVGAASECTGGGVRIAPDAKSEPDRLNVLFATSQGRTSAIKLLVKALSGKHLAHDKVESNFHERCRIACENDNYGASLVYGDGEYLGVLPASLQIGNKPLRVLVPNANA
ncbi:diacylglycerol/lipid kinase family protein [Actibacterium pelagium]|nr:diacylglycerol kinase family protein [Actibacterium pelagium]